MIRKLLRFAAAVAVMHLIVPTVCAAQQVVAIDGMYRSDGVNPNGTKYRGTVEIAKDEQTYLVRWLSQQVTSIGIGIVRGDVLAVSYFTGNNIGIVLYHIEKGPRLIGEWTVLGSDGHRYPETLTKIGRDVQLQTPEEFPVAELVEVLPPDTRD